MLGKEPGLQYPTREYSGVLIELDNAAKASFSAVVKSLAALKHSIILRKRFASLNE
jgi:hypothetical protein